MKPCVCVWSVQVSLPRAFRFEYQGVPCARRQEGRRRIIDALPFQPTPNNLLTEFSIASWEAKKAAAVAAAERDPDRGVKVSVQDDKWAIFLLPVPRPPRGTPACIVSFACLPLPQG